MKHIAVLLFIFSFFCCTNTVLAQQNNQSGRYVGYFFFGVSPIDDINPGDPILSIHLINSFRVSHWLTVGLGIGYEIKNENNLSLIDSSGHVIGQIRDQIRLIPLWLDIRAFLHKRTFDPYVYANIGYTMGQVSITSGSSISTSSLQGQGYNYVLGIGMKFDLSKDISLVTDLGYRGQHLRNGSFNAIAVNIGIAY